MIYAHFEKKKKKHFKNHFWSASIKYVCGPTCWTKLEDSEDQKLFAITEQKNCIGYGRLGLIL